jgi:hypothetical protein
MSDRKLVTKDFTIVVSGPFLRLSKDLDPGSVGGVVNITPAEVDGLTGFLGTTKILASRKALPAHVTATPFRIFFGEGTDDTTLTLFKKGGKREDMVPFTFGTIDDLITLLHQAVNVWKDTQTIKTDHTVRPSTPAFSTPEPTFDGLN